MKGHCLLKLMQFGEHLSGFPVRDIPLHHIELLVAN
jgi:hypothetical protein